MTADTFKPQQHPRAGNGRFTTKPWSSEQPLPREHKIRAGATGMTLSGMFAVQQGFWLIGVIFTVTGSSILAWGGVKKRRKKKRAGLAKTSTGTKVTRFGTVRLSNAEDIEAFAKWQQARWDRRDAKWAPRKAAARSVAYTLVGKKVPQ